ncbi:MAG: FAD-dependent oxidoreductase, partial [Nocardioides sp.]
AGQIAELAGRTLRRDFRAISSQHARVILVDAADQVLGGFGQRLGKRAEEGLNKLGVEVMLGAMVTDVAERTITVRIDGEEQVIDAVTKIWAAGVRANPLAETLAAQTGAALDRGGRIEVLPDLTLPGHPEVFVVGDMMSLNGLPGVAQVAIQGAKYTAKVIDARLRGRQVPGPFTYFDKGSMAVISRFNAVVSLGKLQFSGFIAWLMWLALHLIYIIGFKNQITALIAWMTAFFGRGTSERTTTEQQIFGRQALAQLEGGAAALVEDSDPEQSR